MAVLAAVDAVMIGLDVIEPEDRLVTQPVLMSMIAATIVELGAALTTIVVAVFRVPKKSQSDQDLDKDDAGSSD